MSAAESAHGPDQPGFPGTVLPFPPSRPRRHQRSERTTVPSQPTGDLTPHERIAATLEAVFKQHGRTLTDDSTALDVRIALTEVRTVLKGALETGILTEDQHQSLDTMVEGMLTAAELLTGGD
jgi:hypothetical protein